MVLAIPLLAILYFTGLSAAGMLGPDEPRYASIGREMARSGDWITPRLWGVAWFEKPALLYWMTGAAFRLGFNEDLAPRVPVALLSVLFLIFFQWILSREFGARAAWTATVVLGTSAAWLGYSFIGTTDLPMAAAFSRGHAAVARLDPDGETGAACRWPPLCWASRCWPKGWFRWHSLCLWPGAAGGSCERSAAPAGGWRRS